MSSRAMRRQRAVPFCRERVFGQSLANPGIFAATAARNGCSGSARTAKVRRNPCAGCVARYYDPSSGEFLSIDPAVGLTEAPYFYAGDDPVNEGDPTGLGGGICTIWKTEAAQQACMNAINPTRTSQARAACPTGQWYGNGKCVPQTAAGVPCPDVASDGVTCLNATWNKNNPFAGGEGGICIGGDLVTPFGGLTLQGCWVGGIQTGVTFTHAWGSHVRGLAAGVGLGGFTSNAQCVQQLSGAFHTISGSLGPFSGSHATGGGVTVLGYGVGVGLPAGGLDTTTNTNYTGSGGPCTCG
jgi:RHS repeat-associated protein